MKVFRFFALQIIALFPFIYPLINFFRNFNFIRGPLAYLIDNFRYYKLQGPNSPFPLSFLDSYPNFYDRYESAGILTTHYGYMDLWAAKKIYQSKVETHYDIGSRFDGFICHCLVFCKIVMLDIRPLSLNLNNLSFIQANCMSMPHIPDNSLSSISTLHAVEHFGLGRYGDPIDPVGYKKAINEIQRVTAVNGNIYFAVPVGRQRLEFNAHRIFNPTYVVELFDHCELVEFSAVNDKNIFIENASLSMMANENYGCGLYHFKKIK